MSRASCWLFAWAIGTAPWAASAQQLHGAVIDTITGRPISGATVIAAGHAVPIDADGEFQVLAEAGSVSARAPGYWAGRVELGGGEKRFALALTPIRPRAVYMSAYGLANTPIRSAALRLQEEGSINAFVIDFKGDRGETLHDSPVRANAGARAYAPSVPGVSNVRALLAEWHQKGIYLIARIVVFKDDPLATAHPEWAVHRRDGSIWRDREQLQWIDPSDRRAWSHYLDLIEEVAPLGVDEVQLDYVRFPDAPGLAFAESNDRASRVAAIGAFLRMAHQRLEPYDTYLAADIFGYVCWNQNDTGIGQQLEELGEVVDYISPMLYPSGFTWGIDGLKNPTDDPGQIVRRSLARARARTGLPGVRFRPWLQAFRDYAFDRKAFGPDEIHAQIQAAEDEGADGWMLWNPRNRYDGMGAATAEGGTPVRQP